MGFTFKKQKPLGFYATEPMLHHVLLVFARDDDKDAVP